MKTVVTLLLSLGICYGISLTSMVNYSTSVLKNNVLNNTVANKISNITDKINPFPENSTDAVNCLGLGQGVGKTLEFLFQAKSDGLSAMEVRFFLSSRKQLQRAEIVIGKQFGLEWTDFKKERMTVIIVHGFMSDGNQSWISDMEKALFFWEDVNVIVVDWSAGGNTWNYLKAAVNTKVAGYQISKMIGEIYNNTINATTEQDSIWGSLYCIGHSLGAHICGVAANEIKKSQIKWRIERITGLDPAQPCFQVSDNALKLDKNDAPFIDIIHTNARLWWKLGLGIPNAMGHFDFYPNGGNLQPGCVPNISSIFDFLQLPVSVVSEAICSHGRSYIYLTESIMSAATEANCSFFSRLWNMTYKGAVQILLEPQCTSLTALEEVCAEMGINANKYHHHGSYFTVTSASKPYCNLDENDKKEVKKTLLEHLGND